MCARGAAPQCMHAKGNHLGESRGLRLRSLRKGVPGRRVGGGTAVPANTDAEVTIQVVRLVVLVLLLAAVISSAARRLYIPESVALVTTGLLVGALFPNLRFGITPSLVLAVLVPGLVFEAAYRLSWTELRRSVGLITLLAVPGVVISATVVALVLNLATGLPVGLAFVVGAMVAATDPVAVVATFRRLHAPARLATVVEGESLLNDGTGLVLFAIGVRVVASQADATSAVLAFASTIAVSVLVGVAGGWLAGKLIVPSDDRAIEITVSIVLAYGAYLVADAFGLSGIIATVISAVTLRIGIDRAGDQEDTIEALDTVWGYVAFALTAIVFLVVGLTVTIADLSVATGPILWGTAAIVVARAFIVYGVVGAISHIREIAGRSPLMPRRWRAVVFWAGLRGGIAVAAALSLPTGFPQRVLLQEITFGIVLLTLIVQGASAGTVVRSALRPRAENLEDVPHATREGTTHDSAEA